MHSHPYDMKKILLSLSVLTLSACAQSGTPSDAGTGEIRMAEMMGISVEELRSQTPEEHMQMMLKKNGTMVFY